MTRFRGAAVGLSMLLAAGAAQGQAGKAAEFRSADPNGPVLRSVLTGSTTIDTVAIQGDASAVPNSGIGVQGQGGYVGVEGIGPLAVSGYANGADLEAASIYGLIGYATNAQYAYGVRATGTALAAGQTAYGVYASAYGEGANYAVYADGDLAYTGSLIGPPSDLRLKEGLTPAQGALAKLMDLEVVRFTYRDTPEAAALHLPEGARIGFVAQQVADVLPELVVDVVHPPAEDRMPGRAAESAGAQVEEPLVYRGIQTMEMIPLLVQALQEQQAEIAVLREELAPLRHRLAEMDGAACEPLMTVATTR